jgi:hypothetical protein
MPPATHRRSRRKRFTGESEPDLNLSEGAIPEVFVDKDGTLHFGRGAARPRPRGGAATSTAVPEPVEEERTDLDAAATAAAAFVAEESVGVRAGPGVGAASKSRAPSSSRSSSSSRPSGRRQSRHPSRQLRHPARHHTGHARHQLRNHFGGWVRSLPDPLRLVSDTFGIPLKTEVDHIGIPAETDWPYDIATYQGPPPERAVREEDFYRLTRPYAMPPLTKHSFKQVFSNQQTISFGFEVYESFESSAVVKSGIVPMPKRGEEILGGHEVLAVGYLKSEPDYVLVRNSWGYRKTGGRGWGLNGSGYFLMPWRMILDPEICGDWTTIVRPIYRR